MRLKRYMVSSKSAKLLVVHLQWGAIFYASWCNFYFMRFGAILCKAIFVIGNDNFPWFKLRKLLTLRWHRSCAGPQAMFDIFLKEVGTLFVGRHKTGPCDRWDHGWHCNSTRPPLRAADHGVAIFKMKLMSRHCSWLEVETVQGK